MAIDLVPCPNCDRRTSPVRPRCTYCDTVLPQRDPTRGSVRCGSCTRIYSATFGVCPFCQAVNPAHPEAKALSSRPPPTSSPPDMSLYRDAPPPDALRVPASLVLPAVGAAIVGIPWGAYTLYHASVVGHDRLLQRALVCGAFLALVALGALLVLRGRAMLESVRESGAYVRAFATLLVPWAAGAAGIAGLMYGATMAVNASAGRADTAQCTVTEVRSYRRRRLNPPATFYRYVCAPLDGEVYQEHVLIPDGQSPLGGRGGAFELPVFHGRLGVTLARYNAARPLRDASEVADPPAP